MGVRGGLLLCTCLAAFALPGAALAIPQLNVSATAEQGTTIGYVQTAADPAAAKIQILVDAAISRTDLSAAAGTTIGSVAARAAVGALDGAVVPLAGSVVVRGAGDSYRSSNASVPIAATALACTGTEAHTAFWVLSLTAAGQAFEVPVFVDAVSTPLAEAMVTICLPAPETTMFRVKLLEAFLTLKSVFAQAPGEYRWRALVTPYGSGTAAVDSAATVETQSLERAFGAVSLVARRTRPGRAAVSGSVTEAGRGVPGARVVVRGGRRMLVLKTDARGRYAGTVSLRAPAGRLRATAVAPARDLGPAGCLPGFAPIPCVGALVGGFTAQSSPVSPR